jgi:MFS family permease
VRDLLRIADFRRLYLAQAISDIGDGMTYLALFLLVMSLSGSTALIALVSILVALPPVTIGLFAGAWADRSDRRRIMVASDSLRAVLVLALVPAALAGSIPLVLGLAFVQSIVGTFFSPARGALVPKTIPASGFLAASSLGQATRMVAGVIGATVTGALAAVAGVEWPVFIVDAATFVVSVLLVSRVTPAIGRPDAAAAAKIRESGMARAVRDGLGVIGRSGPLLAALAGITVTMLGVGAINVLFVPFLVRDLGGSPAWAGPMEAAQTASMILAGALMAVLAAKLRPQAIFVGSLVGVGACIALLGASPNPMVMLVMSFAVGWFVMPLQAVAMTIVAAGTTDGTRGRVGGAFNAITQTASIASMAIAGIFADVVGMRVVFYAGGAVAIVAAAVSWALFRWRPAVDDDASPANETGGAASMPHPPVGVAPG